MLIQQILILLLVLIRTGLTSSTDLTLTPFAVGSQYEYSYSTEVIIRSDLSGFMSYITKIPIINEVINK